MTFADPLIQNTLPAPVVRVIRQFESDNFIVSHFDSDQHPRDISGWRVRVVELERKLCSYDRGSISGPFAPFQPPAAPSGAPIDEFAVTQPGAILAPDGTPHSYAVAYPADLWPWPIPAVGRLATTPLVIVRVELRLPGGIIHRRPFGLAIVSSDTSN